MSTSLAIRLLNEISNLSNQKPWVALHGAGEPLLHKNLTGILQKASQLNLDIGFLTNAALLDPGITKKIMDIPISWIGFSIDGIDREKFNKYRCGAEYEIVVRNAMNFIEFARKSRPDMKLTVNMTMQDEMKNDVTEFVKFWLKSVDEVYISPCRPIGLRDNLLVKELPPMGRIPCYMLFTMMVIYWDGNVGLCCEDWFNDGKMGNLMGNSIGKIWNEKKFSQYRALHNQGRFDEISLCKDCNSWYNSKPETVYDRELQCHVQKNAWQSIYRKSES